MSQAKNAERRGADGGFVWIGERERKRVCDKACNSFNGASKMADIEFSDFLWESLDGPATAFVLLNRNIANHGERKDERTVLLGSDFRTKQQMY